jgi:hypothetical protein
MTEFARLVGAAGGVPPEVTVKFVPEKAVPPPVNTVS